MNVQLHERYNVFGSNHGVPTVVTENYTIMAYIYPDGGGWVCKYWEDDDDATAPMYEHFDTEEEARQFLTGQLVLARML